MNVKSRQSSSGDLPAEELAGDELNQAAAVESFAETALKLGGKSAEEARRTGAIDSADDQVEDLFKPEYQTVNSPVHRAIWEKEIPIDLFCAQPADIDETVQRVMDRSVETVQKHLAGGTVRDSASKITEQVFADLAEAGYWGLLVDKKHGGSGASFRSFAGFLTRMATVDPTIAGLASVHGCIGAVDPVRAFGSEQQKQKFLPKLASGASLSAFALTEPCAGSDLTALRTRAVLVGDHYVVNGEKLFITNAVPGRTIGLVCLINDQPSVLICELPESENEHFQLRRYGLYALKHTHNNGLIFRDFKVPAENVLKPPVGNGLTIAYHGLNLGRVALCANAAGTMRTMLANMIPWAGFRKTYGESIDKRELVRRRIGRLAGLIVACDALVAWCSTLIDLGYRGEMECIIAKIFGSEAQKEAAIELFMKTHGGRSFLHGHIFGDHVHEYLAPCIYEGEGEMLSMAFFKSLVKHHGRTYFEPVAKAVQAAHIKQPQMWNPRHLWAMKGAMMPYASWLMGQYVGGTIKANLPSMPARLHDHADFACQQIANARLEISGTMRRHQLKLADRQVRMSELSSRIQKMIVILCTSLYASAQESEVIQQAADVICSDLARELECRRQTDREIRAATKLGQTIIEGGFDELSKMPAQEILMRYEQ